MDGSILGDRKLSVRAASSRDRGERGAPRDFDRYGPPRGDGPPRDDYRGGGGGGGYPSGGARSDRPAGATGIAFGHRIEVENLGDRTSWQDLKDFGRQAGGSIKYADIFNKPEGKSG